MQPCHHSCIFTVLFTFRSQLHVLTVSLFSMPFLFLMDSSLTPEFLKQFWNGRRISISFFVSCDLFRVAPENLEKSPYVQPHFMAPQVHLRCYIWKPMTKVNWMCVSHIAWLRTERMKLRPKGNEITGERFCLANPTDRTERYEYECVLSMSMSMSTNIDGKWKHKNLQTVLANQHEWRLNEPWLHTCKVVQWSPGKRSGCFRCHGLSRRLLSCLSPKDHLNIVVEDYRKMRKEGRLEES
jgi:hypothetical protein